MPQKKFRILAIDGGGIRGVISAKILERVREKIGQPLNEYFDLIAGTSTGSILAATLVRGEEPTELVKLYQDKGQKIFKTTFLREKVGYWLKQPKYSNEGLKEVLQEYFGKDTLLKDVREQSNNPNAKARLLILAYSTSQRYTNFFLSPFVDKDPWYANAKLWEVCLCSSAAPTFFPPYKFNEKDIVMSDDTPAPSESEFTFVDGGVAANNPSLGALVHTLDIEKLEGEKVKLEDISLLSIGTGRTTAPFKFNEVNGWGALGWAKRIPDVFMGGQFQITADLCAQLIRASNPNGYLRIQLDMNRSQGDSKDSKTRCNPYTKRHLNEDMDRAELSHVNDLIETTTAFLDCKDCYRKVDDNTTKESKEYSVDLAIEKFIEDNR